MSQVATLGDEGIDIELMEIVAAIQDPDDRANASDAAVITLEQLKLMIRQQIKAEGKTALTDDVVTQAYRQCGSV